MKERLRIQSQLRVPSPAKGVKGKFPQPSLYWTPPPPIILVPPTPKLKLKKTKGEFQIGKQQLGYQPSISALITGETIEEKKLIKILKKRKGRKFTGFEFRPLVVPSKSPGLITPVSFKRKRRKKKKRLLKII